MCTVKYTILIAEKVLVFNDEIFDNKLNLVGITFEKSKIKYKKITNKDCDIILIIIDELL